MSCLTTCRSIHRLFNVINKKNNLLMPGILMMTFFALWIATEGNACKYRHRFQQNNIIEIVRINHLS